MARVVTTDGLACVGLVAGGLIHTTANAKRLTRAPNNIVLAAIFIEMPPL
jgi:hypothetical protein